MKKIIGILIVISSLTGVIKSPAQIGVGISVGLEPPALPVYVQPACPVDGDIWTPGYWAWGPDGYYWVPGVWIAPPEIGFLWTPGYWGFVGARYYWHEGYWGPHVGFYGGVCYGFGYGGVGYFGGRWDGGHFRYNTAVSRVNTTVIHNTYVDRSVSNNYASANHTSFNGGRGINARPTAQEQVAARESHAQPTSAQVSHRQTASSERNQLASVNHGRPATTAMSAVHGQRFTPEGHSAGAPAAHTASPANTARVNNANNNVNRHAPIRNSAPATHNVAPQHPTPAPVTHNTAPQHTAPTRNIAPQPQHATPAVRPTPAPMRQSSGGGARGGMGGRHR